MYVFHASFLLLGDEVTSKRVDKVSEIRPYKAESLLIAQGVSPGSPATTQIQALKERYLDAQPRSFRAKKREEVHLNPGLTPRAITPRPSALIVISLVTSYLIPCFYPTVPANNKF